MFGEMEKLISPNFITFLLQTTLSGRSQKADSPSPACPVCHAAHQTLNVCHRSPPDTHKSLAPKKHSWVS